MGENDANLTPAAETKKKHGRINVSVLLLPSHFCCVLLAQPAVSLCDGFCLVWSGDPCLISTKMKTSVHSTQHAALPSGIAWESQGCTLEYFASSLALCIIIVIFQVPCQRKKVLCTQFLLSFSVERSVSFSTNIRKYDPSIKFSDTTYMAD